MLRREFGIHPYLYWGWVGLRFQFFFGNDLLWNDLPYSKGFMKFGCYVEPSKIMFYFLNVSYIWHFQWTNLRYIYGIFYIVANCTSIEMIMMYISRTWKYVCCSYPNKFAITRQCNAYINYVFLEDKRVPFTFPFFSEIRYFVFSKTKKTLC